MSIIKEKDPRTLANKMKEKRSIISAKRTLVGVLTTLIVFSKVITNILATSMVFSSYVQPNIEYMIAKNEAANNSYITSVLEDKSLSRKQQIANIYIKAIDENPNIPDETKEVLKEAFVFEVIENVGNYLTEDTIKKMYAVAKTQKVKIIPTFISDHLWFNGEVEPLENAIVVADKYNLGLIAHEELHLFQKKFDGTRFCFRTIWFVSWICHK